MCEQSLNYLLDAADDRRRAVGEKAVTRRKLMQLSVARALDLVEWKPKKVK